MQLRKDMRRALILAAVLLCGCHSAQLRGAGPGHSSAVGRPSSRQTAMPPPANHPANYGYGSAYDPHAPGSRATTGRPIETGAAPFWPFFMAGPPMGVPPPVRDPGEK